MKKKKKNLKLGIIQNILKLGKVIKKKITPTVIMG